MKKFAIFVLLSFLSLSMFAQSQFTDKGKNPAPSSATGTSSPSGSSYTIGPEDVINIAVWKEPDFSATVPVRPDGKISLQLIGDVQAAGKTPEVLADDITALLKKYVEQPRVTVMVTTINSRRVFLLGEINRPGPIVITAGMTVLQAIAAAGGPTAYANSKKIYVLRKENGHESKLPFNYKEAMRGNTEAQNIELKAGDTIVVP